MKKRIFSSLLAVAMAATMLAGCSGTSGNGGSTDGGTTSTSGGETTSTSGGEAADTTQITIYRCTYNLGAPDTAQVQKVEDAINAYLAGKGANFTVDLNDIASAEYGQKANLAFNNGEVNLLWNASWWGDGIGTNDIYANGGAYDLTELIKGSTLEGSMDAGIWEASKYDGKIYFVPVYKEAYEGYDLKLRAELVDKYGWDLSTVSAQPDTLSKLKAIEPFLADLKADGVKYPYDAGKTAMFFRYYLDKYDFFTQNALFGVDRATNTVVDPILSDDYAEFCKLMGAWYEAGYISEDDLTKATPDNVTQTQDWGFNWWTCVPGDEANTEARDNQDEIVIDGITGKYMHSTTTLGSCFTVSAKSTEAQAKACVDFLGYLFTDSELADLYTFGIKDEDYTINDEGRVVQTSEKYNHSAWESTSVKALTLLDTEDADKVEQYVSLNESAQVSCAAGFRFDKAPVEAQYTACVSIMEEMGRQLELGAVAPDDVEAKIAEYQAALDAAGYQDVLAEFQKQYDAWK